MTDFSSQHDMLNRLLGIQEIDVLQLNSPNYTRNLNENLKALRENIDKILSVPFLQGAKGSSIEIGDFPLFTISRILPESVNSSYILTPTDFNYMPTSIGQKILKVLFPLVSEWPSTDSSDWINWRVLIDGYNGDQYIGVPEYRQVIENTGYHAYDNLFKDFSEDHTDGDLIIEWNNLTQEQQQEYNDILDYIVQNSWVPSTITVSLYYSIKNPAFNYDILDTSTWYNIDILQSASYFVFYDYRLKDISSGNDSQEYFKDTSAAIFRERIEDVYEFVNKNLLPTVYYNFSLHMFCWCINGIETNIICEGIPGKDGDSMVARLVNVDTSREIDLTGSVHGYYITQILNTEETPIRWIPEEIESTQPEDFNDLFNNGQMAIAFGNAIGSSTDQDIFFGIIRKYHDYNSDNEYWLCYMNTDVSVLSVAGDISALNIFNNLGSDTSVRGLYVRDAGWNDSLPNTQFCHILYSDDANSFKLCPCNPEFAEGDTDAPERTFTNDKLLKIGYKNIEVDNEKIVLNVSECVKLDINYSNSTNSYIEMKYIAPSISMFLGYRNSIYVNSSQVKLGYYPFMDAGGENTKQYIKLLSSQDTNNNFIILNGNTTIRPCSPVIISTQNNYEESINIKHELTNIISKHNFLVTIYDFDTHVTTEVPETYIKQIKIDNSSTKANNSLILLCEQLLDNVSTNLSKITLYPNNIHITSNRTDILGEVALRYNRDTALLTYNNFLLDSEGISIKSDFDVSIQDSLVSGWEHLISISQYTAGGKKNVITICPTSYPGTDVPYTGLSINEFPITFNAGQSMQKICLTYYPLLGLARLPYKFIPTHPSLILHNGLDNVTLPIDFNDSEGQDVMTRIAFSSNKQTSSNENYLAYLVLRNPRRVGDSPDNYVWRYDVYAETATYNYDEVPLTYQTDPTNNNSGDSIFGGGRFNHLNEIVNTIAQTIAEEDFNSVHGPN